MREESTKLIPHNNFAQNQNQQPVIKNGNYVMNYISSTTFGFVNSEDEARMMSFNRGFIRGYFFDLNKNVFYFKEVDTLGQVLKFETYEYNIVIPPEPEKPVTHDDLTAMQNNILSQITALLQQNKVKEDDVRG